MRQKGRIFWTQLVEQFGRSGLTHEAFAAQQGVCVGTLRKWIYRLKKERAQAPRWIPVRVSPPSAPPPSKAPCLPPAPAPGPLEALLPDGLVLRFAAGTQGSYVADVLDHLRRPSC